MSEPTKWRKKPVEIEAMRCPGVWCGDRETEDGRKAGLVHAARLVAWLTKALGLPSPNAALSAGEWRADSTGLYIGTLEGTMHAAEGDWIIRGVQGEFYPCKPDIFAATYEAVPE
jgi:hypothetical protein